MRLLLSFIFLLSTAVCFGQNSKTIIICGADTKQPLPFATVKFGDGKDGVIADINGRIVLQPNQLQQELHVSRIGYQLEVTTQIADTIFLVPANNDMAEITIVSPFNKIRRIINKAITNKDSHNPEKYSWYQCGQYYKMTADILPNEKYLKKQDSTGEMAKFVESQHLLFSETYSRRTYKKPSQLQEVVLASKFSGLRKTYFTNLVTGVLPFHIYGDFIKLNEKDYLHPVSKGWQQRYDFKLIDEIQDGNDTVYVLEYKPKKNAVFNSLTGTVYINTNQFAISHFTANSDDSAKERYVKMEQVYAFTNGKWFPKELNYRFTFKKYPSEDMGMVLAGHCIVDSVSYTEDKKFHFDKAHPVKLHDSVDLRTAADWAAIRQEPITAKEVRTYQFIDSISDKVGFDKIMYALRNSVDGRLSISYVDLDLKRLFAYNTYEGTRLGLGVYTNDRISKYFSVGGWFGYGFKDKVWKYGASARVYPRGDKDLWLDLSYQNNYRNTGSIRFHPELDRNGLRNWVLAQVDQVEELTGTFHTRAGYWDIDLSGMQQKLNPQYAYTFNEAGITGNNFTANEASIGLRYAYGEKRSPIFNHYVAQATKHPIVYARISGGELSSGAFNTKYVRVLAAITYKVHINRWGTDHYRLEGGMIATEENKAIPRSYLLAGNGFRMGKDIQLYSPDGFMTMLPFQYFNDQYASLLYKHDFDKRLYDLTISKQGLSSRPFVSLAHNILYGTLNKTNQAANPGIQSASTTYNESGLILNHLLRVDYLHVAYINLNAGAFYHWDDPTLFDKNIRFTIGASFDL